MKRKSPSIFTLVELLVVITIIMVLLTILLPSLKLAKERTQSSDCLSRLRQFGQANHMYVNDNDSYLPFSQTLGKIFDYQLHQYVGYDWTNRASKPGFSIYHCPSGKPYSGWNYYRSRGYGYNGYINENNTNNSAFQPRLQNQTIVPLMMDVAYNYTANSKEEHAIGQGTSNPGCVKINSTLANTLYYRHSGRVNVVFADGHSSSRAKGLYVPSEGGFIIKDTKWYNGGLIYP
jgi:prepilin-type processing-associated H-X9-DG protein